MEAFVSLRVRSLEELLWKTVASRREGLVVMRDRDGLRHGAWIHRGFVVGIHVAGRFDPLLDALRRRGSLDERGFRACLDSLHHPTARSGALAVELGGAPRQCVRDALKRQSQDRMAALLAVAAERGHDAGFEPGSVPPDEIAIRMPLGALLPSPHAPHAPGTPCHPPRSAEDRCQARKRLRDLAKKLHPDLHGHLDPVQRRRLEQDLAAATAAYHGLAS